jgi:hypothetical protein
MSVNTDDVIAAYVKFRDDKDTMESRHKEELAPLNDKMRKIEMWLQNQLQLQGLSNFKGEAGTAFLQTVSTMKVEDRESLFKHCAEQGNWELVDGRVSKSVVEDYIETHGKIPPGVSVKRETVVRIRRG